MALTRKMLKDLGLEKEVIDSIMEEHGETINGLKEDLKTEKENSAKVAGELKDLKEKQTDIDVDALNKKVAEYEGKVKDYEYRSVVDEAIKDLKFSSVSAKKAFLADLKEKCELKDGKLEGYDKFYEDYKKEDAGAFIESEQKPKASAMSHSSSSSEGMTELEKKFYSMNPNLAPK